jgi:FAD binding domain
MQDAFNLAWKLAVVFSDSCNEHLLDSYSVERSAVGDQVLKMAATLTTVGTMKNPVAKTLRNLVGHIMLGISPVQHAFADRMTEVTIGYPNSPLNGPSLDRRRSEAGGAGRTSVGPSSGWRRQRAAVCSFRSEHHSHGRSSWKISRVAGAGRSHAFPR